MPSSASSSTGTSAAHISATGSPVALHVVTSSEVVDVQVAFSDGDVTVAEVFEALGVPVSETTVDGVLPDLDAKAPHTFVAGATVAAPHACIDALASETSHTLADHDDATVEVAVVAGLDAGRLQQLAPGRYRLGAATGLPDAGESDDADGSDGPDGLGDADDAGWYLAVDPPAERSGQIAKPWHRGAEAIEVVITGAGALALGQPIDAQGGVIGHVHRPPRQLAPAMAAPAPVDRMPDAVAQPAPFSWATVLAPIPVAILMAVFFRPFFALFAAMGPLIALGRFGETRRRYRQAVCQRNEAIASLQVEIAESRAAFAQSEACRRWVANPHVAELWRRARVHSRRLWERRPAAPGYLTFTIGVAPALVSGADLALDRSDALAGAAGQLDVLMASPVVLRTVPHVVDLAAEHGVGFHGERRSCLAMARAAILQLATLHGPVDLRIGVVCGADAAAEWDWIKWLPHVAPEFVAEHATVVADGLVPVAHTRSVADARSVAGSRELGEVRLLVVDDPSADVAAVVRSARDCGLDLRVIAIAAVPTQLPAACTSLVAAAPSTAEVVSPQSLGESMLVCPTGVSGETATAWARALAPMIDPECDTFSARTHQQVGLLSLIDFDSPDQLARTWAKRSPSQAPSAYVGTNDRGAGLVLDLDRDGPHMLIAGTTGSGKSELLRTMVVSLASACPPTQLNFVLVDFKGGGAFDACDRLPHIAGLITDLDEHLVERAITSLRAELHRREQLFRSLGVSDHRSAAERASQRGDDALPRLMIVVDEFAALASDYPDLMTSIVDLAARGRSLGMHLVLATQRPSGVVDQKIRANTNLRIALRVQDAFDSQDVVGVGDAAHIDRATPGRAVVSIGGDRPFTMQCAYAAAPDQRTTRCTVAPLTLFGDDEFVSTASAEQSREETVQTELEVLVDAIDVAASGYRARQLWSDPLPERLTWVELRRRVEAPTPQQYCVDDGRGVALGLVDTPETQQQQPWFWYPDSGPLVLFGSSAQTCAHSLISVAYGLSSDPDDPAHLYVIDGDAGTMASLMEVPSTGAYVSVHETDRIERTLSYFEQTLDARRRSRGRLAGGVSTSPATAPRLTLIIDNLASVLSRFDDLAATSVVDRLAALCRDGTAQRIHVVIASRTVRDVPHRLAQQFPNRITAELSDPTAYLTLGLRSRDLVPLPSMRVIDLTARRVVQLVEPPVPPELTELHESAAHASRDPARSPVPIGSFPLQLSLSDLPAASIDGAELLVPLGVEAGELATAVLGLQPGSNALVAGAPGRGRSTVLVTIACQVERSQLTVQVVRVATPSSPLAASTFEGPCVATAVEFDEIIDAARGRADRVLVLVDDASQLGDEMVTSLSALIDQRQPAPRNAMLNMVVASTIEFARSMRSWLAPLRAEGRGVVVGGTSGDGDLFKVKLGRLDGVGRIPGRGHIVQRGHVFAMQVATPDRGERGDNC